MNLKQTLESMFRPTKAKARTPSVYIVEGHGRTFAMSRRLNGRLMLWTVQIDGRTYANSKLGDLKQQLGELGYVVRHPFAGLKALAAKESGK